MKEEEQRPLETVRSLTGRERAVNEQEDEVFEDRRGDELPEGFKPRRGGWCMIKEFLHNWR